MRTRKKKWSANELENNPRILRIANVTENREGESENRGQQRVFRQNPNELLDDVCDANDEFAGLREFFGDEKPIHLEIGCGKGRFIIETSRRNPDIHYVAVERDETILATAARRAQENAAGSLIFVGADVNEGLGFIRAGEISRLYINFCDPWSRKKKWAKRRLTHDSFLEIYEKLQIPEIFFKTDNRILFESSLESFSRRGWLLENISLDLHASEPPDNIKTEYEEKFSAHGPIYRLEARNIARDLVNKFFGASAGSVLPSASLLSRTPPAFLKKSGAKN